MTQSTSEGVAPSGFRDAMAQWASGVAVVAVRDAEGLAATTVSSFSSLSLEPPLVVVALSERSRTLKRVEAAGRFTVSVLSVAQREVAVKCAKGEAEDAAFDEGAFVRDGLAGLSCTVEAVHRYGDHLLLVGRVTEVRRGEEQEPLLYWSRAYRAVSELPSAGTENVPK
ncbi:flavin reductase family protein [Pyxidicoccus xibeiensis]|uniref:flavin reductase family protein n=1 Tax=Pyxidicoccus xibeiensis TaxID=2906759 RepID=UPI0020A800B3|nr:flavin reductase family protein [Pyxidicoccus xibeiensis]MCP3137415.1 flavin reductase family protein [Pyxidicoccus xibeiensis]